jgi:sulfonate transport system permease protein
VLGVLTGLFAKVNDVLAALMGVLRPIPVIAWVPVLIVWMGIDESSKVLVIAIASFWPALLNTYQGVRNVDKKLLEVASILEKSKFVVLTKVVIPSAVPFIFAGMRLGVGGAWSSVVGAEMIAAAAGIGYMIAYARELSQPDVMFVGVFVIGLVGLLIDAILLRLERRLLRWNITEER